MKINILVKYKKENKICVKIGGNEKELINAEKKEIKASEIYELFNYKKGKIYVLKQLDENQDIPDEYKTYLSEVYKMIGKIVECINK